MRPAFFWDVTQPNVVILYRCFAPIVCPEKPLKLPICAAYYPRIAHRYSLVLDSQSAQHVTGQPLKVPLRITGFFLLPCNPVVYYTHGTAKESEWWNTASCAIIYSRPAGYDIRQNDNHGDDDSKVLLCVNIYQYRRRLVPKDSSIHTHCCKNLISHWWKWNMEFPRKPRWCPVFLFFKISGERNGYRIINTIWIMIIMMIIV